MPTASSRTVLEDEGNLSDLTALSDGSNSDAKVPATTTPPRSYKHEKHDCGMGKQPLSGSEKDSDRFIEWETVGPF